MDAFVTRKRRRIEPDDESTDFKLATISSLHPELSQGSLLDILLAHDGSVAATLESLHTTRKRPRAANTHQSCLAGGGAKAALQKGKTWHLYSPEDVARHTPCTLIHNFVSADDANDLLKELMDEATTFEKTTFKLFDNVVTSASTSSFYVNSVEDKAEYWYNGGSVTDVRQITPHMRKVLPRVEAAVNTAVQERIAARGKLKYQSPEPWAANATLVNCYDGPAENVGYHSDQLTYLGPRAIIGSLSFGVTREFRVRRLVPQDVDDADADAAGQIAIHLPHNSLLIMHAEMQEEWKHSIAPAQSVDEHPIAGRKRLNVTYRHYKPLMHPKYTPRCGCGMPCVLRVVSKKKENFGKYFWMCHVGNVPEKDGCTFFKWAEFDDDGNPEWSRTMKT